MTLTRVSRTGEPETESRGVSSGPGALPHARPSAAGSAAAVVVVSAVMVVYEFLDGLTKPSPLSTASVAELVPAAAYAVLLATGLTVVALPVALVVDVLVRRASRARSGERGPRAGTLAVVTILASVTVLSFAENVVYTSRGVGLKTDDGMTLRVVFGVLALTVGLLAGRRLVAMSSRAGRSVLLTSSVLVPLAVVTVTVDLATQVRPDPLRAAGDVKPLNVVILSSDGIDADRLSVYGYGRDTTPFLDSRSAEFQVFENAFTNNGNTTGSITALMTGASPQDTGVVYPPDTLHGGDALETLPRMLGEQGYHRSNWAVPHYAEGRDQNLVGAFDVDNGVEDSVLAGLPLGVGPGRWFVARTTDEGVELVADVLGIRELSNPYSQVSETVGDTLSDGDRLDGVLQELQQDAPVFANVHFMGTHGPTFDPAEPHYSRHDEQTTAWQRDFYDDALRQFDGYVETVYEELERSGELDETLLVVTSDHGIKYDATKRVPLLIRYPEGQNAGRVDVNVQRLDVAPTIVGALGFEQPEWMTGQSLLRVDELPADRPIIATTTATRVFPNHFGFRPEDGELLVTYIRCDAYATVLSSGEIERGQVRGSTSSCEERPEPGVGG